jgi:hypothetical protein
MKTLFVPACVLATLTWFVAAEEPAKPESPAIKLKDDSGAAVDVVGIPAKELAALKDAKLTAEQWAALFAVYVDRGPNADRKDQAPLLGTYHVADNVLRFEPRFPLARGVHYRAVFDATRLPGRGESRDKPIETALFIPKPKTTPTVLEQVYPTRDDLPENQLKFYLHFSAPMSRGEAYQNIKLLKADGKPVEFAFLELEQELWNPDRTRFTLLFDPGRVKRGLASREEAGPVLEEGKTYTLVVDRQWTDANGEPLKETFKKTFRVLAPDDKKPDPAKWKLAAPAASATKPLTVTFEKSLDHALLQRMLWVEDDKGRRVEGTVAVAEKETVWRFSPKEAWRAGTYHLVADKRLEDLAANNIAEKFEVDRFDHVDREVKNETVKIAFEVK